MARSDRFEIVFELVPSLEGTYRHEGTDGTTVNRDASGEWTLDEDGELDDIVFFVSPGCVRHLGRRGLLTHKPSDEDGPRSGHNPSASRGLDGLASGGALGIGG